MKNEPTASQVDPPFPFRLLHAEWGIADSAPCLFGHEDYEFITVEYVVDGRGVLESDGFRFECGPDSVYFLHRHSRHRYWTVPEAPWRKLFFIVDGPLADTLLESYNLTREYVLEGVPQLRRNFESMMEIGYGGGPRSDWRAAMIFHQFAEACAETLLERSLSARPEVAELKTVLDRSVDGKFRLEAFCRDIGFSETHMKENGIGRYEPIEIPSELNLYVAYRTDLAEGSEVLHSRLREDYETGVPEVVAAMQEWANLTCEVRSAIERRDLAGIPKLLNRNFDLRCEVCPNAVSEKNRRMVELARSAGASAKFTGSGGAIIGTYENERMYGELIRVLKQDGINVIKPEIVGTGCAR